MEEKEIQEMLKATHILNKYRNFWYASNDEKEIKLSRMIDNFLPKFYNELIEDELARIVLEKINQTKNGKRKDIK